MSDTSPPALHLSVVSKAFGGIRAVDGVSLTVEPGERRALIGPNGAGKTTLFSLISGELRPTAGQIALFGGMSRGYRRIAALPSDWPGPIRSPTYSPASQSSRTVSSPSKP
jgi:ABC-type branched-subunit amino acid transport system ATPase component